MYCKILDEKIFCSKVSLRLPVQIINAVPTVGSNAQRLGNGV